MPFFISLTDSTGLSWSNGPLHAGSGGGTQCLLGSTQAPTKEVSSAIAIGAGVGGLAVGLIGGYIVALYFVAKRRRSGRPERPDLLRKASSMSGTGPAGLYRDLPSSPFAADHSRDGLMRDGLGYHVEPFTMPTEFGIRPTSGVSHESSTLDPSSGGYDSTNTNHNLRSRVQHSRNSSRSAPSLLPGKIPTSLIPTIPPPPSAPALNIPSGSRTQSTHDLRPTSPEARNTAPSPTTSRGREDAGRVPSHVYVVHHDGGRAPVTVYTEEGTEIVELPPRYQHGSPAPPQPQPAASGVVEELRTPSETDSRSASVNTRGGVPGGRLPLREPRQAGPVPDKNTLSVVSNQ